MYIKWIRSVFITYLLLSLSLNSFLQTFNSSVNVFKSVNTWNRDYSFDLKNLLDFVHRMKTTCPEKEQGQKRQTFRKHELAHFWKTIYIELIVNVIVNLPLFNLSVCVSGIIIATRNRNYDAWAHRLLLFMNRPSCKVYDSRQSDWLCFFF